MNDFQDRHTVCSIQLSSDNVLVPLNSTKSLKQWKPIPVDRTAIAEYIDYHLSPETMTPPPNMPLILNGGGDGGWANVTAQLGAKAVLHCLVHNRQEKTVSQLGVCATFKQITC